MSYALRISALAAVAMGVLGFSEDARGRDHVHAVGSSTVYPFSTVVAEQAQRRPNGALTIVESTGTGGGLKLFCAGLGPNTPDVANASRRIKISEFDLCQNNGVTDIVEVPFGYDGIVLAQSLAGQAFPLTPREIYLALAQKIPGEGHSLIDNPHQTWSQVSPSLPDAKIRVLGPPPTSGTRDAFLELVMDPGCLTFDAIKKRDKGTRKAVCHAIREDGAYVEAGENDNLIIQKIIADPKSLGIFGFSFLVENQDRLRGLTVNGVEPTFASISDGRYPVSRSLYFYYKTAHLDTVPALGVYVKEFTSRNALQDDGYLSDVGLISLPKGELGKLRRDVAANTTLKRSDL